MTKLVFADWVFAGTGTGALDTSEKYAGNSSYKVVLSDPGSKSNTLTHNSFLQPQAQVILWVRNSYGTTAVSRSAQVGLSTYGFVTCLPEKNVWAKYRASFWYDIASNTKWGRVERWIGSAWVQQGTDYNFGTGSPAAGSLILKTSVGFTYGISLWFDEVEVYS